MKHVTKILIIILVVVVSFWLLVPAVGAEVIFNFDLHFLGGLVPCGTRDNPAMCTICDFYRLLANLINFMLYITASLATLMAAYIAFLFLFFGGSPQKITDAKSKLRLLIWGIIVVLGSWLVINTILNFIANQSAFPWPWNRISC